MGKGIIKSGGDDGFYEVELTFEREGLDKIISSIDTHIEALTSVIDIMDEGTEKELLKLERNSYIKKKEYLQNNMPEDPTVSAWCADLTEDIAGNVGTIEVPGERGIVQIQPGYENNSTYDSTRDGQLQPSIASTPASTFYNLAMLPGWQKWKPTYRYGVISNIDNESHTCDVKLDITSSSQQSLDVNQELNLFGIPVSYMSCDSSVFENGDNVLVKFDDQEWANAKVIGFKDNPAQCCLWMFIFPYLESWPFSIEYELCLYISEQLPPFCSSWWTTPLSLTNSGILQAAFEYSDTRDIDSVVAQIMTFEPGLKLGNTSGDQYLIVDFENIDITGSSPSSIDYHGLYFRFRLTWQHDDEIDPFETIVGNVGTLTLLTSWSLSASGIYYQSILFDLLGNYGPIDFVDDRWINTSGYTISEFAIVAQSASGSTGATGVYITDAQIIFNSFKICQNYPDDAVSGINLTFS